ncbi:MAG: hypothetical protein ACOVQK_09255, partial [Cyanobium sp.]
SVLGFMVGHLTDYGMDPPDDFNLCNQQVPGASNKDVFKIEAAVLPRLLPNWGDWAGQTPSASGSLAC